MLKEVTPLITKGSFPLTALEREIVRLVAAGYKDEEIATRLSVSKMKVSQHLTSIYQRLGVSDRLELIIHAFYTGIAVPQ
jgi:DNA-binding CsgD family transcriptional regulator